MASVIVDLTRRCKPLVFAFYRFKQLLKSRLFRIVFDILLAPVDNAALYKSEFAFVFVFVSVLHYIIV